MKYVLFACFAILSSSAFAALHANKTFDTKILPQNPNITIYLPVSYEAAKQTDYPVIFVLDGDTNGYLVDSMLQRMHLSQGANEHIVVGIESQNRLRDFAPTVNRDPRGPVGQGGGGDRFLDFMQQELIPYVESHYRTADHKVIAGHSVGGLLVMHSFQSRPDLFQAHMAFSPAVWWGNKETLKATEEYVLSNRDIQTYLYMNIGNESGALRADYDSLARTLVRNRTLDLSLHVDKFDNDGHDFTMVTGLYNALKGLYKYQQNQAAVLVKNH